MSKTYDENNLNNLHVIMLCNLQDGNKKRVNLKKQNGSNTELKLITFLHLLLQNYSICLGSVKDKQITMCIFNCSICSCVKLIAFVISYIHFHARKFI